MASIQRRGKGWRAQVARAGIRRSRVFDTKAEAKDWAARVEYEIKHGEGEHGPGCIGDLFDRYAREVSPKKKGMRWEQIRLERLKKDDLAKVRVKDMRPGDFADWRDRRLKEVSASTVKREMNLIGSVLSIASAEWGLVVDNPIRKVAKPKEPPHRTRLATDDEIAKLVESAGTDLSKPEARAIQAFRFSVATGMRAGEVLSLRSDRVSGNVAHLPDTKNGQPRDVPLSADALALWGALPGDGFQLTSQMLDVLFRRVRDRVGIKGLRYHDSRHNAATAMSKKVNPLQLARILGHKDLKMTMIYYNESAEDIAKML